MDATEQIAAATGGRAIVDVREDDEWAAGHVPGSTHVPLAQIPARVGELPEGELLVVCRSGGRSERATAWLVRNGFDAENYEGGLVRWARLGLPIMTDEGVPGVVI